jgi:NhaC family Na+:H+ antiporter
MVSGVVPTMIYYGMKVILPQIFLFATCIISALIAIMTGSSWTTIATIGVALVGIGTAQGYESGWIAGAIISGAYFGDKVSPLSDTTVLASSSSETPLFTHIRYMMVTTVPSFIITLVVFLVASILHDSPSAAQAADFSHDLKETFNISPWLLLVPVLTAVLIIRKVSAIVTLFIAAFIAGVAALFFQPHILQAVANGNTPDFASALSFIDGFKGLFISFYGNTAIDTGNVALNDLISTRGMTGMLNTVFLIMSAGTFCGTLVASGMLHSLTELLTRFIRRRVTMVASTVGTGIFANMITGDQYLSIILTSSLYKKLYQERGYENRLLSRSVEDSATVVSVLIPWNSCGMTQSTVLKVSTLDYLPYCFFNIISPLMSIFISAIGYKIIKKTK